MYEVELDEVAGQLPRLLESALRGEEVLITRQEKPVLKLVPVPPAPLPRRRRGSAKGQIHMAADFDAPVEDFTPYPS
jgi:antitoxin (DNA-binding transcriptional repressor) of toxin-antitoxin stability system